MFESQRHEYKGDGGYCAQCPQVRSHWVHQVVTAVQPLDLFAEALIRFGAMENKLKELAAWLDKRSSKRCSDCGGQNLHDRCDNEPRAEDFAEMAEILNRKEPDEDPE